MKIKIIMFAIPCFFRLLRLQKIVPPINNANVPPPSEAANGITYSLFPVFFPLSLQDSDRQRC